LARVKEVGRSAMYVWLAALFALLVAIPFPDPNFGPFEKLKSAEQFLRTLWQVEAAALALSLTIIVFAVQAYRSSTRERYGGTLRRFIRASFLQEGYELGVISLLLLAVVLMGFGHGGPSGSAGLVAVGASLFSIATLPPLLSRALKTTHNDFFHEERSARLALAVQRQVDHEVEARLGMLLLSRLSAVKAVDLKLFGGQAQGPEVEIPAGRDGLVADIRLSRLLRLARRLASAGRLQLRVRLAQYVGAEFSVLVLPRAATTRDSRLGRKVVRIKAERRRETTLSRYLDDLQEEAIAAIRAGGPATFESIANAYVETLMEFPRSWQRYGQQYDDAVAQGVEFFPVGPVEEIRRQLYTNVVEALRAGGQDVLLTAAYLPLQVSSKAIRFRADGLLGKMLALSPSFLAAAWANGGDSGRLLEERTRRHLIEFVRFYLEPRLEEGSVADRLRAGAHIRLVYTQIQAVLKMGVDSGQTEFIRRLDGDWGTLLQHLDLEILDPDPLEIPFLEQAVDKGDVDAERLQQARQNAELQDDREALTAYRAIARFGLALWAWRKQSPSWRESFAHFSAEIGGLAAITRLTTKAFEAENRDLMPWSDWILNELQEGEAHAIGTTTAILETFVALGLRAIDPNDEVAELPPADWMSAYLDQARELLDAAPDDERNSDLPDIADRAGSLLKALESGAERWKDQERATLIEAPLVQGKVDEFRRQALDALREARVLPDLLRIGGTIRRRDHRPDPPPLFEFLPHKALFVEDERVIGGDMVARDIGRKIAHRELGELIEPMSEAAIRHLGTEGSVEQAQADFVEQLNELIEITRDGSNRDFFLFLPIQWRLSQALGIPFLGAGAAPPETWELSKGAAGDFVGAFAGVPAFQFPEVPGEVLYLVDLSRYVEAEVWSSSDAERLSIVALSEEEAEKRAARTEGREEVGEQEMAMRWQEHVVVVVDPGLRLAADRDQSAITAIAVPSAFQQ